MSTAHLTRMRTALARALSIEDVNQLGRDTGQSERLRTVTPHRLFLSTIAGLAGGTVESIADLLREFNHQNDKGKRMVGFRVIVLPGSLCAAVLKRFLAHAAQLVGDKPISTRRVAMCADHIIDDIVAALLACVSIAAVFRDGVAFLLANARRSNPKRDRKTGRLRAGLLTVGASR